MAKEVILTPFAVEDFDNVVDYLTRKWSVKVANDFIERFAKIEILLSKSPGLFPFFDKTKRLQRCVVTKHNILYFIETEEFIKVITVFDTRQNPEKLKRII